MSELVSRLTGPTDCRHIDLHCHSTVSDGSLSPTELVARMAEAGVRLLALTDHDSTDGLAEARVAAEASDIRLLNGVEISSRWRKQTVHIVGLGVDPQTQALVQGLASVQELRAQRAVQMAAKLEKLGLNDALARATALADGGQLTRTHFARLLVNDKLVKDLKRAFSRFLAAGKPGYVVAEWPDMDTAIAWIHAAGGLAVLAHPMRYGMSHSKRRQLLDAFVSAGGDATEVHSGPNRPDENLLSFGDARRRGLMASVGSDFHDPAQRWIRLGAQAPLPPGIEPVWEHAALA